MKKITIVLSITYCFGLSLFGQYDSPSVEWKINDIPDDIPISPITSTTSTDPLYQPGVSQYDAGNEFPTHLTGEDWWYSIIPDPNTGGYITSGFATWVYLDIDETSVGGCKDFIYSPGLELSRPVLSTETLSAKLATIALYDKKGNMVWCKALFQAEEGAFNCKVDLSGNIIVTGWTMSTRDINGNPMTMKFAGGVEYDIAADATVCAANKYKPFVSKISSSGNIIWTHLYSPYELGYSGMNNVEFFSLRSKAIDLVIADNGNYVIVGEQEFLYPENYQDIIRSNPFIIEVANNGNIVNRREIHINGYNALVRYITKKGTGYIVGGGAVDDIDIIDTYNQSRIHGFSMAFDSNLQPQTGGFGNTTKSAIVFDGTSYTTPNLGLIWIENDYNVVAAQNTSHGKTNIIMDAKTLANDNIAIVDIVDCDGCKASGANIGLGELRIYDPSGTNILVNEGINQSGGSKVVAFDMKIGLEADDPNEITLITTVKDGYIDPLSPGSVFTQSMDVISGGTDSDMSHFVASGVYYPRVGSPEVFDVSKTSAILANYDINGNIRWEKIIDIDDSPLQVYPGDWKEQECVYQVIKDDDGAYVFVGNSSHNKDDYLIAKVYGNCHLDKVYNIAPANPLVDNTVVLPIGITTWSPSTFGGQTTINLRGEIIIPNGAYLMISDLTLLFADGEQMIGDTKMIIEPGGQVKVNNSTLTSMDCPNTMWTGIEVHGNSNQPQFLIHQGSLILTNSTIENAHNAVRLWEPDNWNKTGGIIRASNTTFLNNRRDVEFIDYSWFIGGVEKANKSSFSDCSFITDNNLLLETVNDHITLYKVFGVLFVSCDFADSRIVDLSRKGRGIFSIDATYKVLSRFVGTSSSISEYYDDVLYDPCTFYNLLVGVEAMNANSQNTITVDQSSFLDCKYGVKLSQVDNALVTRNKFDRTSGVPSGWMGPQYHIYTDLSTAYKIEGNLLESQHTGDYTVGVTIENSGLEDNEVFKNKFTTVDFGAFSYGKNRNDNPIFKKGLEFLCNENTNNHLVDELILGNDASDGAKLVQGIPGGKAAGNVFSTPSGIVGGQWHLNSNLVEATNYYWYQPSPNEEPTLITGNVIKTPTFTPNTCPTTFSIIHPGPGKPLANVNMKAQLANSFDSLQQSYVSKKSSLNTLESNGNRPSLHALASGVTFWTMYSTWLTLHQEAPYLSEDVLRILGNKKPWEFSSYFLKHLILENIEVANNADFMSFLQTKEYPMPSYYYQQIDAARKSNLTARGLLQADIMSISREKNRIANMMILDLVQDTVGVDAVSFNEWVVKRGDVMCELQLLDNYLSKGQKTSCATKIAVIDTTISQLVAGRLKTELQDYRNFKSDMLLLTKANGSLQGLDSVSEPVVRYYAENAIGYAQVQAQNLLCFFRGECKTAPLPVLGSFGNKSLAYTVTEDEDVLKPTNSFKIYPNPTREFVVVSFDELVPKSTLQLVDMSGKIMHQQVVDDREIMIDVSALDKGIYLVYLLQEGNILERDKLIIQ